jgi:hypothetical protein
VDVVAELRSRQRLAVVVEQIAAGFDLGDVGIPGLRVHRHHQVDAATAAEPAALADAHFVPGRQPWILDGKMLRGLTGTPMRRMALANSSLPKPSRSR